LKAAFFIFLKSHWQEFHLAAHCQEPLTKKSQF